MQAIVKIGSTQYFVSPNQEILIPKTKLTDKQIQLKPVLLAFEDDNILIGQPELTEVVVKAEVLGEVKGDKVRVAKYKSKSRYRKVIGFRAKYTKVKIISVAVESKSSKKS